MRSAFFIGLLLSSCSFTCSNTHAMDSLLKNISSLVAQTQISKTVVESTFDIKLSEDKKASAQQGMQLYDLGMDNSPLVPYGKAELRIYNGASRFLLLLYPKDPVLLKLGELKQAYHYTGFTASDNMRKEAAGYHFEKNGYHIHCYCDKQLRHIIYISIEGNIKQS